MATAAEVANLREAVAADPEDVEARVRLARALERRGDWTATAATLRDGLVNLTAHDGPTLPCLCERCLQPDLGAAEADGMAFERCFVVARGRVLWYWAPVEMARHPGLVRNVQRRLDERLARQGVDP